MSSEDSPPYNPSASEDEAQSSSQNDDQVENETSDQPESADQKDQKKNVNEEKIDKAKEEEKRLKKELKKKKKREEQALKTKQENKMKGVIYISKVPPFMKPEKVRYLMSQYGEVGRIYLTPEPPSRRKARKKGGGSKKICYLDGWVEFLDKRVAKRVALSLNNTYVGGGKRNFHNEFLWNLKYLSKFKWENLSEHKHESDRTRDDKVKTVLSQAKRENELYLKSVDKAKMIDAMKQKKNKDHAEKVATAKTEAIARKQLDDLRSTFKQRRVTTEDNQPVKQQANIKLLQKVMGVKPTGDEPPLKKRKLSDNK